MTKQEKQDIEEFLVSVARGDTVSEAWVGVREPTLTERIQAVNALVALSAVLPTGAGSSRF